MNLSEAVLLETSEALALLAELPPFETGDDVVKQVGRLRARGFSEDMTRAVLRQRRLRSQAVPKFGEAASKMFLTDDGLQQATRSVVAEMHAERFAGLGKVAVADLGCGIGGDALALAGRGLSVTAFENDAATAMLATHNLKSIPSATVVCGDATEADLSGFAALWFDPARRNAGKRLSEPKDWSPSLDWVFKVAAHTPSGIKLSPAFPHELIPTGFEAQWVQDGQDTVECVLWSGTLARPGIARSALVIRNGLHEISASEPNSEVPVAELGSYLADPGGAVIRAELLGELAKTLGAVTIAPGIGYLSADTAKETPFADWFKVLEVLPLDQGKVARRLGELGVGILEIKKRGVDIDPAKFRTGLKLKGKGSATLFLTRLGNGRAAILAERLS